ncbi:hypothetical protein T11_3188 [Trichinella zimbabwensis]|uniref:Uncharacterized protein n=1 Tax=Trichinella zimbabwensis TaxID=268475 RepID=A0A0V1H639_9BILA|nr:hypothetical protein T11_3188 [Trichinella zimbabwensis]
MANINCCEKVARHGRKNYRKLHSEVLSSNFILTYLEISKMKALFNQIQIQIDCIMQRDE